MKKIAKLFLTATFAGCLLATAAPLVVSPDGNDANPGSPQAPFATVQKALDTVRKLPRGNAQKQIIVLRGGLYELSNPLVFKADLSHVELRAAENETPILSGGKLLTGWETTANGLWQVKLPKVQQGNWNFRQLFIRHRGRDQFERRYRPSRGLFVIGGLTEAPHRYPNQRINHRNPQDEFYFRNNDIEDFDNRDDVEVVVTHDWSSGRLHIRDIDFENKIVKFKTFPHYRIGHWYEGGRNPYLLENIKEDLGKTAGCWYLDRPSGVLSYKPLPGETIENCEFVAPRIEKLVTLDGDNADRYLRNVHFKGITFAHSAWFKAPHKYATDYKRQCRQGFVDMPSAVELKWTRNCSFDHCDFVNLGSYGLDFGVGAHENSVSASRFIDLGTGGIKVGVVNRSATFPEVSTGNRIENCIVRDSGVVHYSGHGIWGGICAKTIIQNNDVSRTLYSSIAVGWSHGKNLNACRDNLIAHNHVHDVLLLLDHGGAVYTLGNQPGTVIQGNHIHGTHWTFLHGEHKRPLWAGGGLAFDDGSSGFAVIDNVLYDIAPPADMPFRSKRAADMKNVHGNICSIRPGEPNFPKAIVDKAGLTAENRPLLQKQFIVPQPPILAMRVPTDLPPISITANFENLAVGKPPRKGYVRLETKAPGKGTDGILVTDETAAEGKKSLKVIDAPGLSQPWIPYLSYSPNYDSGTVIASFALRVGKTTKLGHNWRGSHPGKEFSNGPGFTIENLKLVCNDEELLSLPENQWVSFTINCKLGKLDPGIGAMGNEGHGLWNLHVTLPGGKTIQFDKRRITDPDFANLKQVMFISMAEEKATFYLDALTIRSN